jgi:GNAT superfamily N-acetyltransferase
LTADVVIRPARDGDLAALPEIERAAAAMFREYGLAELFASMPTPLDAYREGLANERLWVAETPGSRVVGFALAGVVGCNAHLEEIDVHPEFGGRGIGKAMIQTVFSWARASGYRAMTLTTMAHVPWNAPFYERMGFRILGEPELTPELRGLLEDEFRRGVPRENRVAMMKQLGQG